MGSVNFENCIIIVYMKAMVFLYYIFQSLIQVKTQEEQNIVPSVDAIVTTRVKSIIFFSIK
jgi:hypothetical protein